MSFTDIRVNNKDVSIHKYLKSGLKNEEEC